VSIDVKSVLPNSNRTHEIEWIETTHDLNGGIVSTDHWKGAFTIALNPPTEERLMRVNPLGVYVTDAAWTKVL
jgi:type IV secretory pathway TrbF-like protein